MKKTMKREWCVRFAAAIGVCLAVGFLFAGTGSFGCGQSEGEDKKTELPPTPPPEEKKTTPSNETATQGQITPSRVSDHPMSLPSASRPGTTEATNATAPTTAVTPTTNTATPDVPAPTVDNMAVTPTPSPTGVSCDSLFPAEEIGGCRIRLVTPGNCEEIDFARFSSYQFAWSTDGTNCETPYKLQIAGNPPSELNALEWSLSEKTGEISKTLGGIQYISAADLQSLSSNNGSYHWRVLGFYGSHPASQVFKVKK